jgi:hypothetical protein
MMNFKVLEDYLKEIDHYLAIKDGKNEILNEIRSHILEKTEHEFGKITENTLRVTIEDYGNPRLIAEKYMEGYQIISPIYKKYLFLYTGLLFAVHYGLILVSAFSRYEIVFFPFFYIPIMGINLQVWFTLVLYLPMTFFYDFGLICLILYFVTQNRKEIKLPWFGINLNWLTRMDKKKEKPNIYILGLMIFGLLTIVFLYLRYNTIFFLSMGAGKMTSLFNPSVSEWLSLSVISIFFLEILHYTSRFFIESPWIKLTKDGGILIIFWSIMNLHIEDALIDLPGPDISAIITFILLFFSIIAAIEFLKSLIEFLYLRKNPGSKTIQ